MKLNKSVKELKRLLKRVILKKILFCNFNSVSFQLALNQYINIIGSEKPSWEGSLKFGCLSINLKVFYKPGILVLFLPSFCLFVCFYSPDLLVFTSKEFPDNLLFKFFW